MKKTIGLIAILVIFLTFPLSGSVQGDKEKINYENWLEEEVALLISQEEKEEFEKLNTAEEKDLFIELFWLKRDPSPGSRANELRDAWYRRLAYVTKTFTRGTQKGWRSDQGKVYMFFGAPPQTTATAPQKREVSMGGSQLEAAAQIWMYGPMPDLGLQSAFRITFRDYQFGYEFDQQTPQSIRRALEVFPSVIVLNPDIEELPTYKFYLGTDSLEGKLINDFIESGQQVSDIPLEWTPIFTRAMGGDTHVSFLVRVDPKKLDKKKLEEMIFFGRIKGEEESGEDFLSEVETEKGKENRLLAIFGLPAHPGKCSLYLGARGDIEETYSLYMSDLEVPDFSSQGLATSTIILSPEVSKSSGGKKEGEAFNPFEMGEFKATPRWGNIFSASEFLNVLFHVYNAQRDDNGSVDLSLEYFIMLEDGRGFRLNPQEVKQKVEEGEAVVGGTQVPLDPLKPGKYSFRIKVTDNILKRTIEKSTEFIVK